MLKTQSHKGEGSNELHFEDEAGEEAIYFHAQKDMQQLIENDQSLHILANQHWDVTQDRVTQVTNNDHLTLEADSHTLISKDSMLAVKASHHQKVSKKQLMKVGSEVHLKSKGELVLDAGSEITLSGGGSFLKVDPAGVHLVGAKVNLNSGGGAGSGSQCKVKKPEAAMTLDEAICPETGEVIKQAATLQVTDIEEVEFDYTAIEMVQTQGAAQTSNVDPLTQNIQQYAANNPYPTMAKRSYSTIDPDYSDLDENDVPYSLVTLHHTGDPTTPGEVENIHRANEGIITLIRTLGSVVNLAQKYNLADVGYHYMIAEDGTIYEGRSLDYAGAHVSGNNKGNIGIAFLGDYTVPS